MTLQDLSLIAQILGVLLVSGSLLFVGLQMRQTHAIERANAQRDLLDQTRNWWLLGVEDEAMFDTISAGLQDFRGLSRFQAGAIQRLGHESASHLRGRVLPEQVRPDHAHIA